jgi:hypothetical protein
MSLPLPAQQAGLFFTLRPMDSVIWNILVHHPEDEWLDRCRSALPLVSDSEIITMIQPYFYDDVELLVKD